MTELVITRGYPGSGKTTFARQWVNQAPKRARVSRDDYRLMLFGKEGILSHEEENQVTAVQRAAVSRLLTDGYDVIEDGTNLRRRYAQRWAEWAQRHGATFRVENITTPVDVCLEQNYERSRYGNGRYVDPEVIRQLASRFPLGTWAEVEALPPTVFEPYTPDPTKLDVFIVDIDGTLAHMTDRGPHDYSRVSEDVADETMKYVASMLYMNSAAILVSGRPDSCRADTELWLRNNGIRFDALHMRRTGDNRDDSIVKYEIFRDSIAPRYNVVGVFDDRNRVVDMWRRIGLKCFQVQPGDF
ncbi:AAA family ATPase [Nocardia brasiliensis]|uniref:phosphatase domain-containing protein n=1 Tax=Nocardia brasiliensis TaxID=37326 RepID=UPI00245897D9|nr:AAA family ATPase [Nocardia brasiliensis]